MRCKLARVSNRRAWTIAAGAMLLFLVCTGTGPHTGAAARKTPVVAIIDSGVDPGVGVLDRVLMLREYSGEGRVATEVARRFGEWIESSFGRLRVGSIRSVGGNYRVGVLRETSLNPRGQIGQDLDGNGMKTNAYAVLVVDSRYSGRYDTVYVDINKNRDFTDDIPLMDYSQGRRWGSFQSKPVDEGAARFVVANIAKDGSFVDIGFDGHGHGTAVVSAVIEAGGKLGIPIRVMVYKAVDSAGVGTWESVTDAIRDAAANGAQVIFLSCTKFALELTGQPPGRELISEICGKYGCVVVAPTCELGPGLSEQCTPTDSSCSLAIGGYIGRQNGLAVWPLGGVGPTRNGGWSPDLLAPVRAAASWPSWAIVRGLRGKAEPLEGTDAAAAEAAAQVAWVMTKAAEAGRTLSPRDVVWALLSTARKIDGFSIAEQGAGILDSVAALGALMRGVRAPDVRVFVQEYEGFRELNGVFRSTGVGAARIVVQNHGGRDERFNIAIPDGAGYTWPERTWLTPGSEVEVRIQHPYDGLPRGVNVVPVELRSVKYGYTITAKEVVFEPVPLKAGQQVMVEARQALHPGRMVRHAIKVEPGVTSMDLALRPETGKSKELAQSGVASSWAKVYVHDPKGRLAAEVTAQGEKGALINVTLPDPGVWEVVVVGHDLSPGEADVVYYSVDASAKGIRFERTVRHQADGYSKVMLSLFNCLPETVDVSVKMAARADSRAVTRSQVVRIGPGESASRSFKVSKSAGFLRVTARPLGAAGARAWLGLFRLDPLLGWVEVGAAYQESGDRADARLEVESPAAGEYTVYVETSGAGQGVECVLSHEVYYCSEPVTAGPTKEMRLEPGSRAEVEIDLGKRKATPGYGYLLVGTNKNTWVFETPIPSAAEGVVGTVPYVLDGEKWVVMNFWGPVGERADYGVLVGNRYYQSCYGSVRVPWRALEVNPRVEFTLHGEPAYIPFEFDPEFDLVSNDFAELPEPTEPSINLKKLRQNMIDALEKIKKRGEERN